MPHMHVRGKDFLYKAVYPTGETETLLDVPKYDFNWQLGYEEAKPLAAAEGDAHRVHGASRQLGEQPARIPTRTRRSAGATRRGRR